MRPSVLVGMKFHLYAVGSVDLVEFPLPHDAFAKTGIELADFFAGKLESRGGPTEKVMIEGEGQEKCPGNVWQSWQEASDNFDNSLFMVPGDRDVFTKQPQEWGCLS